MGKILNTGATELLGSSLVTYLNSCGHQIVTHARASQFHFMFDLSNQLRTLEQLGQIQPNMIINLAGEANQPITTIQILNSIEKRC